jgi:Transglycosylase SLT domain
MNKILSNFTVVLLLSFYALGANADVFGYAEEGGAIFLSDTPSDEQYQLLVASPIEPVVAAVDTSLQIMNEGGNISTAFLQNLHYRDEVKVAAKSSGVESALLHAVIITESNYNPKALSPKGAMGLMQLMPFTARRFGVYNINDPAQNIQGGARYLAFLLQLFNNDFKLAIAAYNAGENAVIRHGNQVPPYRETVNYVSRVMGIYKKLKSA